MVSKLWKGTNTKAELMGAWATLYLANLLSLHKIQILGDSKVIIDWLNYKSDLRVSSLEGWKQRIQMLRRKFEDIQFYHIYRDYNKEADGLSKQALLAPEGIISLHFLVTWSGRTTSSYKYLLVTFVLSFFGSIS
jgi:ribonuclease HI